MCGYTIFYQTDNNVLPSTSRSALSCWHLKSLVIPLLEYCCQLWNPWKAKYIQVIEGIQWTFTYKITEGKHLIYWERLHELNFHSLQRRRERYIITYIWKITQHMVSNIDGTMGLKIKTRKYPRIRAEISEGGKKTFPSLRSKCEMFKCLFGIFC